VNSREGIALVAKAQGSTSFQALEPLKRCFGTTRLGHTGTLDKFATGLLVVLLGRLTKLVPWFTALDKVYEATVRFGEETDTLDPEGQVIGRAAPPGQKALEEALASFRGPIMQTPPAYSSIHVDGERASDRARRGEKPDMQPRRVSIHELELLSYDGQDARLRVRCSSGTYIRSLARDLANFVGSRARLDALSRIMVGPFSLSDARPANEFNRDDGLTSFDATIARALGFSPTTLAPRWLSVFENGGRLEPSDLGEERPLEGKFYAVFTENGKFLGVAEGADPYIRYRFVLSSSSDDGRA